MAGLGQVSLVGERREAHGEIGGRVAMASALSRELCEETEYLFGWAGAARPELEGEVAARQVEVEVAQCYEAARMMRIKAA